MVVYSPTEATSTRHISPRHDRYFRGHGASAGGERHGGGARGLENSGSPVISNLQISRSDIN